MVSFYQTKKKKCNVCLTNGAKTRITMFQLGKWKYWKNTLLGKSVFGLHPIVIVKLKSEKRETALVTLKRNYKRTFRRDGTEFLNHILVTTLYAYRMMSVEKFHNFNFKETGLSRKTDRHGCFTLKQCLRNNASLTLVILCQTKFNK